MANPATLVFLPQKRSQRMNVLGSPSPMHPSSLSTGTFSSKPQTPAASSRQTVALGQRQQRPTSDCLLRCSVAACLGGLESEKNTTQKQLKCLSCSHPQDSGLVSWSHREGGGPQDDHAAGTSRRVGASTRWAPPSFLNVSKLELQGDGKMCKLRLQRTRFLDTTASEESFTSGIKISSQGAAAALASCRWTFRIGPESAKMEFQLRRQLCVLGRQLNQLSPPSGYSCCGTARVIPGHSCSPCATIRRSSTSRSFL